MDTLSNQAKFPANRERSAELFREHQQTLFRRTDRMFAYLMVAQWMAGIIAAIWISPRTWIGAQSQIHVHVWAAIFIGGIISAFPVMLAWKMPGRTLTRHVIAIGQMLTSALLIHLTGGRVETHFHIFGSLAFLAFYRDWRVLLTATAVVAADHFARGMFWPQSVFGVLTASPWRWVEHAGWVVFEDVFLLLSIIQSLKEMRLVTDRQAGLEAINEGIEKLVEERTLELESSHKKLVEVSRNAGMAEVAVSVLHNVGNVLNSINVSTSVLTEAVQKSKSDSVGKVANLLKEHAGNLGEFFSHDPKGKQVPGYIEQLAAQLSAEKVTLLKELNSVTDNVEHIKHVVAMQQNYGKVSGIKETVKISELVEDALRIKSSALKLHHVNSVCEFADHLPEVEVEKHKVLQILVNLIKNAKESCVESGRENKCLTVRVANGGKMARIELIDNGVGISPENLTRIFSHGFTTKQGGHGFGLHNGALVARELGGRLRVQSEGLGRGATFTLELPCKSEN